MKHKFLLITFNIVLFCLILLIFLLPFLFLGQGFFIVFWKKNILFFIFSVLLIASVDVLFFYNWKLLSLLENEDWENLKVFLEDKIYNKNRINNYYVHLLCNAYFLNSDTKSISRLEDFIKLKKIKSYYKNFLTFMALDYSAKEYSHCQKIYSKTDKDRIGKSDLCFIQLFYGLSFYSQMETREAGEIFHTMMNHDLNPAIGAIIVYLLESKLLISSRKDENQMVKNKISRIKQDLQNRFSKETFLEYANKKNNDIYMVVLNDLLTQSAQYIFS